MVATAQGTRSREARLREIATELMDEIEDLSAAQRCSMEGCTADAVNVAVIEYAPRGLGVPVRVRVPLCAADWSRRPEGI